MNQTSLESCPDQGAEIEKHKYFLSEKAGYDVGWETAEQDWMSNHAEQLDQVEPPKMEAPSAGRIGNLIQRLLSKAGVKRRAA